MFLSFHPLADETNNDHLPKPFFQGHSKIALTNLKGTFESKNDMVL